jgi:hypothetical protein
MPQMKHVNARFRDNIKSIETQSTQLAGLPSLLLNYKADHISSDYADALTISAEDGEVHREIPVILAVDALAIEPYSEKTKRMLLLKQVGVDLDSQSIRHLKEKAEISTYFFVYYMMPLDPLLPKFVISVIPHMNGKANEMSNAHLLNLKSLCQQAGFLTVAFSGDGDSAYAQFLKPISNQLLSAEGQRMTYLEHVAQVAKMDCLFVTDLLHFIKCLRNRIATHPLSLHSEFAPIMADELAAMLPVGDCLKPKSKGSQLKDAIALRVFTLENLITFLVHARLHEALYFLAVVLWRVANQAVNVTRQARIHLLGVAFEVAMQCAAFYDVCGLPHTCGFNETTFFWRREDIDKMLVSLVVVGVIPTVTIL